MCNIAAWKMFFSTLLVGVAMLACQSLPTPASTAQDTLPAPNPEMPGADAAATQQPTAAPPVAVTDPTPDPTPTAARRPLPFIPPTLPPILNRTLQPAATATLTATVTPVPAPTTAQQPAPTAAVSPEPQPEATPESAPAASPQPTAVPVAQPEPEPAGNAGAGGAEIAAQLAELGSALQWAAEFDQATKSWSVYDPSGTFDESRDAMRIPHGFQPAELASLRNGQMYWIAVSQNASLGESELLAGINQVMWSGP
ncbi:MAG: hypothetical protein OXI91_10310 [Chloroflexota bacterium]|nr:hypothetical protein [Chloroflexota bacterium]